MSEAKAILRSCTANGSRDVDIVVARKASGGGGGQCKGSVSSESSAAAAPSPAASSTPTSAATAAAAEEQQPLSLLARHDEEDLINLSSTPLRPGTGSNPDVSNGAPDIGPTIIKIGTGEDDGQHGTSQRHHQ